jgi:energy-coupling factor transporter ATP-binding protein EcfA2
MSEPLVHAVGLEKHYRTGDAMVRAVADVSLSIDPGEFVAVVGRSGSGKSTLMSLLGLLERPDVGQYGHLDPPAGGRVCALCDATTSLVPTLRRRHRDGAAASAIIAGPIPAAYSSLMRTAGRSPMSKALTVVHGPHCRVR